MENRVGKVDGNLEMSALSHGTNIVVVELTEAHVELCGVVRRKKTIHHLSEAVDYMAGAHALLQELVVLLNLGGRCRSWMRGSKKGLEIELCERFN